MVTDESAEASHCNRIVVVSEPGRNGDAALARAAELASEHTAHLTVVATAPQTTSSCRSCGGVSPAAYNQAVRDDIAQDLHHATGRLHLDPDHISVKLLIEGRDPPLAVWIAWGGFDLVLLPARRAGLRSRSHPTARLLHGLTSAEVQVVTAAGRYSPTRPS